MTTLREIFRRLSVSTLACLMLQSCFTGVESTPKITGDDVRREKVTQQPEQRFLADIVAQPFDEWLPGKLFFVTDNKIRSILLPTYTTTEHLAGKFLSFQSAQDVNSVTGKPVAELTFLSPEGRVLKYRIDASLMELKGRQKVVVPFTIEKSVVDEVSERIKGKSYYVVNPVWYDEYDQSFSGRKYIPVSVVDVEPGTEICPVRLFMADENGRNFFLLMSLDNDSKSTRSFSKLFSFTDPRLKYPSITDEVWQYIIRGRVALAMTREECRLALGGPRDVVKRPANGVLLETWSYENGMYLIFEDGILTRFGR